jgi:hypothetical protein
MQLAFSERWQRRAVNRLRRHERPHDLSAYDGSHCLGFVLARGKVGFEAFDRDERSLGVVPTQEKAIGALHAEVTPWPEAVT